MLESQDYRPVDKDVVYRLDVDPATITQQVRAMNDRLKNAVDNSHLTVGVREPTQSLVAALTFTVSGQLVLNTNQLYRFLNTLRESFSGAPLEIDMGAKQLAVSIEQYEPSAFMKQIAYTVADLPA